MSEAPLFSVVMATHNRGHHIVPSLRSVLAQTRQDFELLVVGDHCTDDTGQAVATLQSDRVRWLNLPERGGSQSFPNNAGIAVARGRYIAYLGHDDLWAPDHLATLEQCFSAGGVDYAVSGALLHPPLGVDRALVTGMFEGERAPFEHFFPPSSLAHRRDVIERIGGWRDPVTLELPVDAEMQLRAARAGLVFAATGRITAHKFTASQRYLSHLVPASDEQQRLLARLLAGDGTLAAEIERTLQAARAAGRFMSSRIEPDGSRAGERHAMNARRKGSQLEPSLPLADTRTIAPRTGLYAFDWLSEPRDGFLWNRMSLHPRLRIPVTSSTPARVTFTVAHKDASALRDIEIAGPGLADLTIGEPGAREERREASVAFSLDLSADHGAVIQFLLRPDQRGMGVGTIVVSRGDAAPSQG